MATIDTYNLSGEKSGSLDLLDEVFGVEVNAATVSFVANAQRANAHVPYAHTKGRADVRGGGKKPWRQKGTGRARHGSSRSPIWRGGGVTFGPTKFRNPSKKVNKKTRRAAIRMMLSDKVAHNALFVVDSLDELTGKTKQIAELIAKLPMEKEVCLIASATKNPTLTRAARNLLKVNTVMADSVNVGDLLKYKYVIVDKSGVEKMSDVFKK